MDAYYRHLGDYSNWGTAAHHQSALYRHAPPGTATRAALRAVVIVGLMSSYEGLLDHHVANHTWMLFPHGWARHGDWSDVAAACAPMPLLVQYDLDDDLFTEAGMRAAHMRLQQHYHASGTRHNYQGEFYPGPHKFDLEMQAAAFRWLKVQLT